MIRVNDEEAKKLYQDAVADPASSLKFAPSTNEVAKSGEIAYVLGSMVRMVLGRMLSISALRRSRWRCPAPRRSLSAAGVRCASPEYRADRIECIFMRSIALFFCLFALAVLAADQAPSRQVAKADVDRWMKELSNWGRWGRGDQMGTVNLITPAKRKAAAALVQEGAPSRWRTTPTRRKRPTTLRRMSTG